MFDFMKTTLNALKVYINERSKSDWNQNNPNAPDYISKRPFYTEDEKIITLIPETQITVEYGSYNIGTTEQLVAGKTYFVTLDDIEYVCIARKYDTMVLLGNGTIDYGDGDTGNNEPFQCTSYTSGSTYLSTDNGEHTLSLSMSEIVVHKLDDKYLPYTDMTWDKIGMKVGEILLIPEQTITLESGSSTWVERIDDGIDLYPGLKCVITFDGIDYPCTVYMDDDEEPCTNFTTTDGITFTVYNLNRFRAFGISGEHTVRVAVIKERPEIINEKYLPKELARAEDHLTTEDPNGYGSFSMNRSNDYNIGEYSVAMGQYTSAPGNNASATGSNTVASSRSQNVIGEYNIVSSIGNYQQIYNRYDNFTFTRTTTLYISDSYTFNGDTGIFELVNPISCTANVLSNTIRPLSHEDIYIISNKSTDTAVYHINKNDGSRQGNLTGTYVYIYNVTKYVSRSTPTARHKYAHIVGNGTSNTARSNAHTLDWEGNAWFSGDVYTGSTSGTNRDEGSKKLATEEYVDAAVANAGGGQDGYAPVKGTDYYVDWLCESDELSCDDEIYNMTPLEVLRNVIIRANSGSSIEFYLPIQVQVSNDEEIFYIYLDGEICFGFNKVDKTIFLD